MDGDRCGDCGSCFWHDLYVLCEVHPDDIRQSTVPKTLATTTGNKHTNTSLSVHSVFLNKNSDRHFLGVSFTTHLKSRRALTTPEIRKNLYYLRVGTNL
jgi:hypothetical protein